MVVQTELVFFLRIALCGCLFTGCLADSLPTAWRTGIATNYGGAQDGMNPQDPSFGTEDGSCGYGVLDKTKFPYWSVAALSTQNMYHLQGPVMGCGECFEIQCINNGTQFQGRCNSNPNAQTVTVQITDSCPECEPDHIDIQALTFNKMAPMANGRVQIQYRQVECAPPSNINIVVNQNAGAGGWLRLTVQQLGDLGSVSLVQVEGQNEGWQSMQNTYGAAWEIAQQPTPPLDLRVVDANGAEVTAFGIINSSGQQGVIPTGVQFSFGGSQGTSTSNSSSSASGGSSSSSSSASSSSSGGSSSSSSSSSDQVTAFDGPPSSTSGSESPPVGIIPGGSGGSLPTSAAPQSSPPSPASPVQSPPPSSQSQKSSPPPPPPPPPPAGSASSSSCSDTQPPNAGSYTCAQQKQGGHCSSSWMTQSSSSAPQGYCAHTCGRC